MSRTLVKAVDRPPNKYCLTVAIRETGAQVYTTYGIRPFIYVLDQVARWQRTCPLELILLTGGKDVETD